MAEKRTPKENWMEQPTQTTHEKLPLLAAAASASSCVILSISFCDWTNGFGEITEIRKQYTHSAIVLMLKPTEKSNQRTNKYNLIYICLPMAFVRWSSSMNTFLIDHQCNLITNYRRIVLEQLQISGKLQASNESCWIHNTKRGCKKKQLKKNYLTNGFSLPLFHNAFEMNSERQTKKAAHNYYE